MKLHHRLPGGVTRGLDVCDIICDGGPEK